MQAPASAKLRAADVSIHYWIERSATPFCAVQGASLDVRPGEFVVVTVWRDLQSLQRFAGPDWQREGVIPAGELPLLEGTVLHHYEVFDSSA